MNRRNKITMLFSNKTYTTRGKSIHSENLYKNKEKQKT